MEWCLNDQIFHTIRQMTFEPSIDLFASRLNAKVGLCVSWPNRDATVLMHSIY